MPPPRQPERTRPGLAPPVYRDLKAASGAQLDKVAVAFTEASEALADGDLTRAISVLTDAKGRASRSTVVRESLGIALYLDGQFKEAARELAAYRRMSDRQDQNHLLADCARANGQPEKAEDLVDEMIAADVSPDRVAEGLLVVAGARADGGDPDAALAALHRIDLEPRRVEPYHLRLWYLAADLEEQRGDPDAATSYLQAIATVDPEFLDVSERLAAADVDDGHSVADSASKRVRQ
ncbi:MAG TPA: tetratricopeptide repeat protein [Euzebyales bacterium]|nr:tetratricopeptide repeat protein [Euzebyales bacterium]